MVAHVSRHIADRLRRVVSESETIVDGTKIYFAGASYPERWNGRWPRRLYGLPIYHFAPCNFTYNGDYFSIRLQDGSVMNHVCVRARVVLCPVNNELVVDVGDWSQVKPAISQWLAGKIQGKFDAAAEVNRKLGYRVPPDSSLFDHQCWRARIEALRGTEGVILGGVGTRIVYLEEAWWAGGSLSF